MNQKMVRAHFDGERIRLDEPCQLEPETQLLVVILPKRHDDDDQKDWLKLSQQALENAYGEEEPEYLLNTIKDPNPEYEER